MLMYGRQVDDSDNYSVQNRIPLGASLLLEAPKELRVSGLQLREATTGKCVQFSFPNKDDRDAFKRELTRLITDLNARLGSVMQSSTPAPPLSARAAAHAYSNRNLLGGSAAPSSTPATSTSTPPLAPNSSSALGPLAPVPPSLPAPVIMADGRRVSQPPMAPPPRAPPVPPPPAYDEALIRSKKTSSSANKKSKEQLAPRRMPSVIPPAPPKPPGPPPRHHASAAAVLTATTTSAADT